MISVVMGIPMEAIKNIHWILQDRMMRLRRSMRGTRALRKAPTSTVSPPADHPATDFGTAHFNAIMTKIQT